MNSQELRNLQEAYIGVYYELDEAGATSARLADVVRQRMDGRRDFSVLPQGTPSLSVLMNLENNAKQRANDRYPEQSSVRRGEGGSGVPSRSLDPVRISPKERGRITDKEIVRRSLEKDANRNVPLTRREVPIPVRSRPTPSTNRPTSRTNTPLTPTIRDQRAAEAGFSGPGSSPKGSKLARQTQRGVTTGDNPFDLLRSAATEPKPLSKPKDANKPAQKRRGGGSSAQSVGSPSGTRGYQPGGGQGYGISGIKLADSYDLYDLILSHLINEGYAETQEQAEVIMVNMSEDWRESICEGFKRFPYKKVEDKIHKKEAENPTGRGTKQSIQMGKVVRHFKGGKEIPRVEKREHSPQISKAREAENRARGTQEG
jgi:hypothetical protein